MTTALKIPAQQYLVYLCSNLFSATKGCFFWLTIYHFLLDLFDFTLLKLICRVTTYSYYHSNLFEIFIRLSLVMDHERPPNVTQHGTNWCFRNRKRKLTEILSIMVSNGTSKFITTSSSCFSPSFSACTTVLGKPKNRGVGRRVVNTHQDHSQETSPFMPGFSVLCPYSCLYPFVKIL